MTKKESPELHPWQRLSLRVGDRSYGLDNLSELGSCSGAKGQPLEALHAFLMEWLSPRATMRLQTSGSTGEPKLIEACKEHMMGSAEMSCHYFGLSRVDVALLCMDLRYIGAMMLVVRAMVCGMRLVVRAPSSSPLSDPSLGMEGLTFASLVPLQVYHALDSGAPLLSSIGQIVIGGAALPMSLRQKLASYPNRIYASYGMTETLSHIALAPISRSSGELLYQCLEGVSLGLSERQTLIIHAPQIGVDRLETNDLAELVGQQADKGEVPQFRILGRADLVVNTGGVKVSIEALEDELAEWLSVPLAISWRASDRLGQEIVLLLEANASLEADLKEQCTRAFEALPPYHRPRAVFVLPSLPRLGSGKLDRQTLRSISALGQR